MCDELWELKVKRSKGEKLSWISGDRTLRSCIDPMVFVGAY
jgi:hypothetical protein